MDHAKLDTLNKLFNEIDNKLNEALTKAIENTAKQPADEDIEHLDFSKRIAKLQRKYNKKAKSLR